MKHYPIALLLALLAAGCNPNKVYVRSMNAASVSIPNEVQRVAVIDRSSPKNAGQTALGTLEGVVTGEGPFSDHQGRKAAIDALVTGLQQTPRFEVSRPLLTPQQVDSDLFDKPWTHRAVAKLCEEQGCDAVIALEVFDTDTALASGLIEGAVEAAQTVGSRAGVKGESPAPTTQEGEEPPPFTHWAERTTRVNATWRIYDARADRILDEERDRLVVSRSRKEAYSVEEAITQLVSPAALVNADGRSIGMAYAKRIAPSYVSLRRKYYGGRWAPTWPFRPPGKLHEAKIHVKAGDWDGAAAIWKDVLDSAKSQKRRGKARHNLALAAEVGGDLQKAHRMAVKAAVEVNNDKTRDYARSLEYRIQELEKVEAQLAPPEEGE